MTKKIDVPLILLAAAAFLAPLIGGQISNDALSLAPGSSPFVLALMGAPETPSLTHAILGALCAVSLIVMLLQRKIVQVPNNTVSGALMGMFGIIAISVGYSSYRSVSILAAVEWITYGIAFYAVVAGVGRQRGPQILLSALFCGCVLLALLGLQEYANMKAIDPTWRIFPQWVGPNAMAAILLIGFFVGLSITLNSERMIALATGFGCVVIGFAIFLTQSKGAILTLGFSLVLFLVMVFAWTPRKSFGKLLGGVIAIIAFIGLLSAGVSLKSSQQAANPNVGSPLGRIANASTSSDQSVGFRKLLWQSAGKLIQQNPIGIGIGSFQYESAKPGLITQTRLAHESYLQLAAEASPLALGFFIAGIAYWSFLLGKGGPKLPERQNVLRAGVAAAVASIMVHSFIDSDLYYYGVGLEIFVLLGVGMLLSTDAVAPEYLPPILRRASAGAIVLFVGMLGMIGLVESSRAEVRGHIALGQFNDAQNKLDSIKSMLPIDAEAWALSALISKTSAERVKCGEKAAELVPSIHNWRMLARFQMEAGQTQQAKTSLERAIALDPNNLPSLSLLAELQATTGFDDDAKKTLQRLVDTEQTPYFKVRSLPELVPTETYAARLKLAALTSDPTAKIALLQPAVSGMTEYAKLTVPNIVRFAKDPSAKMDFGGESVEKARSKLGSALEAAKALAELYRAKGSSKEIAGVSEDQATIVKALADLNSTQASSDTNPSASSSPKK